MNAMFETAGKNVDRPLVGKKILLAEDEERLRLIVAMMLEELGGDVVTVSSGEGALREYHRVSPPFDLVLLDMRMRGLSGETTFQRLLAHDPNVRVVLSSGITPEQELIDLLKRHRGGFIEKPYNLTRLGEVLAKVLAGVPTIS